MVGGHGSQALAQQVVGGIAKLHFHHFALLAQMLDIMDQKSWIPPWVPRGKRLAQFPQRLLLCLELGMRTRYLKIYDLGAGFRPRSKSGCIISSSSGWGRRPGPIVLILARNRLAILAFAAGGRRTAGAVSPASPAAPAPGPPSSLAALSTRAALPTRAATGAERLHSSRLNLRVSSVSAARLIRPRIQLQPALDQHGRALAEVFAGDFRGPLPA